MPVLYHDHDSFQSFKVRLCLGEKGIAWTSRIVTLAGFENLAPDYVRLNPQGVVPTLVADDVVVVESSIINEYLDDLYPLPALRPADAAGRAKVRMWANYEDHVVHPAVRLATFNLMLKQRVRRMAPAAFEALIATHPWPQRAAAYRQAALSDIDEVQVASAISTFRQIIARMENTLQGAAWLASDEYSLADVAMTPLFDRLDRLGMGVLWRDKTRVADWVRRVRGRCNYEGSLGEEGKRMPGADPQVVQRFLEG